MTNIHTKWSFSALMLSAWIVCGCQPGLDQRPANGGCMAFPQPASTAAVSLEPAFEHVAAHLPLALYQHPVDDDRWYVIEKFGRILTFSATDAYADSVFADLSAKVHPQGEAGLLDMAFHPDFSANGWVYLSYVTAEPFLASIISRFHSPDGGRHLDLSSEKIILAEAQPFTNHNGGQIGFGPDGYLYIGFGDGGSGGDPFGHGQNIDTRLGAMLRIDVDGAFPYAIPPDNPFADGNAGQGRSEIYAWGFRNPWRWSFDMATGVLWLGDVGQNAWEEIDRVERGGNYGWNRLEGDACFLNEDCRVDELMAPVTTYGREEGNSVTGGYVYRGEAIPALTGSYVYGDFGSGRIWRLMPDAQGGLKPQLLIESGLNIAAFGQDREGEIYVVGINSGLIFKLAPATHPTFTVPARLSATGYLNPDDPRLPADGFIPYAANAAFWSDGAHKARWLAVPDDARIDVSDPANWQLPVGSVLMKTFWRDGRRIETRLFMRHDSGQWAGYTYAWADDESDAFLARGGKKTDIDGRPWLFPAENDCLRCHTAAAGRVLGLETGQLNGNMIYPRTGRTAHQLITLASIGLLETTETDTAVTFPRFADPGDPDAPLDARARAYLHVNCAQCHRPQGPTPTAMDLRYDTPLSSMQICDMSAAGIDLEIAGARLLAFGDPDRSLILQRMQRRDIYAMPPVGSLEADADGAALLRHWIATAACRQQ